MELHFSMSQMITGEKRHRKEVSDSDQSDDHHVSRKRGTYSKQSSSSDNNWVILICTWKTGKTISTSVLKMSNVYFLWLCVESDSQISEVCSSPLSFGVAILCIIWGINQDYYQNIIHIVIVFSFISSKDYWMETYEHCNQMTLRKDFAGNS